VYLSSFGCIDRKISIKIPSNFQFSEIGRKGILIRFASSVLTFRELCDASYGNKKESVQS
jgi:hypothetical protein